MRSFNILNKFNTEHLVTQHKHRESSLNFNFCISNWLVTAELISLSDVTDQLANPVGKKPNFAECVLEMCLQMVKCASLGCC